MTHLQDTLDICAHCQSPRVTGSGSCAVCAVGEGSLLGPYRVNRHLGEGSTGRVFACSPGGDDRIYAVKLLLFDSPDQRLLLVDRLRRDARIAGQLRHPNLVALHAVGNWNGCCYLAMELVAGGSAQDHLLRHGAFTPAHALRIVLDAARGLAVAADAGLVHRDVKPSNLLLDAGGRAKVVDFGVASCATEVTSAVSRAAPLLGTPAYMSPEQAQGRWVDFRSDIYSLGIVLYQLLTGRLPFEGASPLALLVRQVVEPLPELTGFEESARAAIEPLLRRMTAKLADDRYATWRGAIDDLEAALVAIETRHDVSRASRWLASLSGATLGLFLVLGVTGGAELRSLRLSAKTETAQTFVQSS